MRVVILTTAAALGVLFLGSAAPPPRRAPLPPAASEPLTTAPAHPASLARYAGEAAAALPPAPPPPPPPPTPQEALEDGVLIVISLSTQTAIVLKDGELWDSTGVSTGRKGKETPTGIFPILQKKVHHRSTLYDDAPMPYMQRLTWDGIALHAGYVPGYPASHGCIRLPRSFAKKLYGITGHTSTIVLVTDEAVNSADEVRALV